MPIIEATPREQRPRAAQITTDAKRGLVAPEPAICVRHRTLVARRRGLALAAVDAAVGRGDRFRRTTLPIPSELDGRGIRGGFAVANLDGGDAVRAVRC
jgi:hypothetical protein